MWCEQWHSFIKFFRFFLWWMFHILFGETCRWTRTWPHQPIRVLKLLLATIIIAQRYVCPVPQYFISWSVIIGDTSEENRDLFSWSFLLEAPYIPTRATSKEKHTNREWVGWFHLPCWMLRCVVEPKPNIDLFISSINSMRYHFRR